MLAEISGEKKQVVAAVNENKIASRNLHDKLVKGRLTSIGVLCEYR